MLTWIKKCWHSYQARQAILDLPGMLDEVADTLQAGTEFNQAFQQYSQHHKSYLADQINALQRDLNLGLDLESAWIKLIQKIPGWEMQFLGISLIALRQSGGAISSTLQHIAQDLRQRQRIHAKMRSATANARAQAWVLCAITPLIAGSIACIYPQLLQPFWSQPWGQAIFMAAVLWQILGIVWVRHILNVD